MSRLHAKTVGDLRAILTQSGVQNPILQDIFVDLYNDYVHAAMGAMRSGIAA